MGSRWSGSELNGEPCQERTTSPLVCSQCYQLGMSISTDPAGICWFGTNRFDGTMAGKASADKPCAMPRQAATQTTVRNSRLLRESVYCHSFRFRAVHDRHWRRSAEALGWMLFLSSCSRRGSGRRLQPPQRRLRGGPGSRWPLFR